MRNAWPDHVHEHLGPPPYSGAWGQYVEMVIKLWTTQRTMNVVFDRFLYGELIYGPLLRAKNPHKFTQAHCRMLERVLMSMQGVLVCCQTNYLTSQELWKERQETELIQKIDEFRDSYDRFELLFQQTFFPSLPRVFYDLELNTIKETRQAVEMSRPRRNDGPGIGDYNLGSTLIIGEQINEDAAAHVEWPFVAATGCSLWLAEQLNEAAVSEKGLYWVNAADHQGVLLDPGFIAQMHPGKIIALGKTAAIWCRQQKLEGVAEVPHPQYWKRFRHRDPYALIEALKEPQVVMSLEETV